MGVPGLYTYLINQYKNAFKRKINKVYRTLSLDMNAIIHPVSQKLFAKHPNTHYQELKFELFDLVYEKIEYYNEKFKPEKLILAFDGPAPIAKIQQQRTRRFQNEDENLNGNHWSSTQFSPGTKLMEELSQFIEDKLVYLRRQLTPDLGCIVKILYSSHRVSGEGEHKIMDIVRKEKGPHLIVGNDADLILLALSNRWDTDIFRESEFRDKIEETFIISKLLKPAIKKDYQSIDNFILITFFVGNDFLLPIPGFNSIKDVLGYMKQFVADLTLTDNNGINWNNFLLLLEKMKSKSDNNDFYNNVVDLKYDEIGQKAHIIDKKNNFIDTDLYHTFHKSYIITRIKKVYYEASIKDASRLWFIMVEWIYRYYKGETINCSIQYTYPFRPNFIQLYEYLNTHIKEINKNKGFLVNKKILPFLTPVKALVCMIPFSNINLIEKSARKPIMDSLGDLFPNTFTKVYKGVLRDHQVEVLLPMVSYHRLMRELSKINLGPLDKFGKDIELN